MMSAFKLIVISLIAVVALLVVSWIAVFVGSHILEFYIALFVLWGLFAAFTLYFFR